LLHALSMRIIKSFIGPILLVLALCAQSATAATHRSRIIVRTRYAAPLRYYRYGLIGNLVGMGMVAAWEARHSPEYVAPVYVAPAFDNSNIAAGVAGTGNGVGAPVVYSTPMCNGRCPVVADPGPSPDALGAK